MATAALIGTNEDPSVALDALGQIAPQLAPQVAACAPEVEDAMWRFLTDVEEWRQKFSSGDGRSESGPAKLGLVAVRSGGAAMFEMLGLPTDAWGEVPDNARPACPDLDGVAGQMTWDVRHLANLIGSDNITDADGYTSEMTALTSVLADLVAECQPKAATALRRFEDSIETIGSTYQPGDSPEVVAQNKDAMGGLRAAGIALFGKLGLDDTGWRVIPTTER